MGRLAACTGRRIEWDFAMKKSELVLRPAKLELGLLPVAPAAIPGQYDLL